MATDTEAGGTLEAAVRARRETTRVDYKERLNWAKGKPAQVETLRDIAGLANREGGIIVVGLKDLGNGNSEIVGLQPDDQIPDPTSIGQLFRDFFDPSIEIAAGSATVDGTLYGYILVPAFTVSPLIATKDMHDPIKKRALLTDGDLVIRSDALATEKVKARDLRSLLDRAVVARGRAFAAQLPPSRPPPADDRSWGPATPGTRLLDVRPVPVLQPRRLREVEDLVQAARVISRYGMVFMPSEIDFESGQGLITREQGRIIAQAREPKDDATVTTAEISTELVVRVREAPWESHEEDEGPRLDLTSLLIFVSSAAAFAVRLYEPLGTEALAIRFGLAAPAGMRMTVNPRWFTSLSGRYVGTSRSDVWVERQPRLSELASADQRTEFAFSVLEEILDYFGWRVQRVTLDYQMKVAREQGGLVV